LMPLSEQKSALVRQRVKIIITVRLNYCDRWLALLFVVTFAKDKKSFLMFVYSDQRTFGVADLRYETES